MISLSYTVTALLKENLKNIEDIRRFVLLMPISLASEHESIWKATIDKTWATLFLGGMTISKNRVLETLEHPPKRLGADQIDIIAAKQTFDFIRGTWSGNKKLLGEEDIEELALLMYPQHRSRALRELSSKSRNITQMLSYLEIKPEHPVIVASTIHYAFVSNLLLPWDGGRLGRALCSIILSQSGYNLRSMIAPEAIAAQNPQTYKHEIEIANRQPTITSWLEYWSKVILTSMEFLSETFKKTGHTRSPRLSDRQQTILSLLENPKMTITNRFVQKRFKISQITASRDLAKLVAFGLLYPHGKGRSVYYTRA